MTLTCSCADFLTIDKTNVYSEASLLSDNGHKSTLLSYLNYGYNNKNCIVLNLKHIAERMRGTNNSFKLNDTPLSRGPLKFELAFVSRLYSFT